MRLVIRVIHLNSGSSQGPPKVIAIIPLSGFCNIDSTVRSLLNDCTSTNAGPFPPLPAVIHAAFANHKAKFTYLPCGSNLAQILDAISVADIAVFVINATSGPENIIDVVI
jgi:hypothetical protein